MKTMESKSVIKIKRDWYDNELKRIRKHFSSSKTDSKKSSSKDTQIDNFLRALDDL